MVALTVSIGGKGKATTNATSVHGRFDPPLVHECSDWVTFRCLRLCQIIRTTVNNCTIMSLLDWKTVNNARCCMDCSKHNSMFTLRWYVPILER